MYGLALEGGGAKGSYEIGAYKALIELGIEIKGVVGTSIGAFNGALIAQGDLDRAYDLWYNMKPSKVLDVDEGLVERIVEKSLDRLDVSKIVKGVKTFVANRGFDTRYFRAMINDNIYEESLRNSDTDYGLVTISLSDKKPIELFIEDIPLGKLADYIMASANFPAFRLEKTDGKLFIDGAFYDNLPISLLQRKGYKNIIAVRLFAMGRIRKVDEDGFNITYITPSQKLCNTLDFSNAQARKNLEMGYFDTLKVFNGLKGTTYYLNPTNDEEYFMNYLLSFGEKKILRIGNTLGIENISYRRMMLEHIIPRLIDLFDLDKGCTYEDIVIRIYEEAAKHCNIDEFKIYDFKQLITEVHTKIPSGCIKINKKIPKFIKKNELLSKAASEEIIDEIVAELFREIT